MATLPSIIYPLVRFNAVVAILSILGVMILREQQTQMTAAQQQLNYQQATFRHETQEKETNQQQITQYAQKIQQLEGQLQEYKTHPVQPTQEKSLNQEIATSDSSQPSTHNRQLAQPTQPAASPIAARLSPYAPAANPASRSTKPATSVVKTEPTIATNLPPSPSPQSTQPSSRDIRLAVSERASVDAPVVKETPLPERAVTTEVEESTQANSSLTKPEEQLTARVMEVPTRDKTFSKNDPDNPIYYANDVAYGLVIAANNGQVKHGTRMYRQVQTAIKLLRRGESKEEASRKAKVPTPVMDQLIKWGENRPGRLIDNEWNVTNNPSS